MVNEMEAVLWGAASRICSNFLLYCVNLCIFSDNHPAPSLYFILFFGRLVYRLLSPSLFLFVVIFCSFKFFSPGMMNNNATTFLCVTFPIPITHSTRPGVGDKRKN